MKDAALVTVLALFLWPLGLLAAEGPTPPSPRPPSESPVARLVGIWYLASRSCTSNADVNDGFVPGTDQYQMTFTSELGVEKKLTLGGCETLQTGKFVMEGRKMILTYAQTKGCTNPVPVPVHEERPTFLGYLDDDEALFISTGDEAAAVCPAGDALVRLFSKIVPQDVRRIK
jgi:hypothetical protein